MHFVDDEHFIAPHLRRNARLFHQTLDVFYRVVGGGIEFEDVVGTLLVESLTTLAMVASLALFGRRHAVDGLGENARTRGLAYATRSAKQVGMSQLATTHGVAERCDQRRLPNDRVKGHRPVFPGRNDVFFHVFS